MIIKSIFRKYEEFILKFTFILFFLQILHFYWLTGDVVLKKIYKQSFFFFPETFLFVYVLVDYLEIPALISGFSYYSYLIFKERSKKYFYFLAFISLQVLHIFWLTDEVVYRSFFMKKAGIPEMLAWAAIFIDYLELPIIFNLGKKVFKLKK